MLTIACTAMLSVGIPQAFGSPVIRASENGGKGYNLTLPFPVPVNMTDPELPATFVGDEIVSNTTAPSKGKAVARSGQPGRANLTMNAARTCNNYRPGTVRFTQYWIPIENTQDAPWGIPAALVGKAEKELIECGTGRTFGKTSKIFWEACHVQGTCYTQNQVLLNLVGNQCFRAIDRTRFPFGIGSQNNPLVPFVSVAVNDLPFGTYIWVKDLYGKVVPGSNGLVHNGCVRVDDTGWGVDPCHVGHASSGVVGHHPNIFSGLAKQIDFFTLTYSRWKPQNWGQQATAFVVPYCKPGVYVNMAIARANA